MTQGVTGGMEEQSQGPGKAPPTRPLTISLAALLMIAGAALGLASIVVAFSQRDEVEETVQELFPEDPDLRTDLVGTTATFAQVAVAAYGVAAVGLCTWMAIANGLGRNWARMLTTLLAGYHAFQTLTTLGTIVERGAPLPPGTLALTFVSIGLSAVIVALLFLPASSAYYQAVSQRRYVPVGYPGAGHPGAGHPGAGYPPPGPPPPGYRQW